ncbi:unnamed protein product [Ectocarpus sp. 12 AP-2014]
MSSLGIPFRLPPNPRGDDEGSAPSSSDARDSGYSSGDVPARAASSLNVEPCSQAGSDAAADAPGSACPQVRSRRTRTVKSRAVFTPEADTGKPRGRKGGRPRKHDGRGRPRKDAQKRSGFQDLLTDEDTPTAEGPGSDVHRKRSRNASDGENRWDRIRAKFKLLLHKMRRDTHFLQVYQQDGWKSSGREKLKPTAELDKARERIRRIQAELREVTRRLTEMNPGGVRWGAIQEDGEGNIEVDEIMCTKCGQGDSDDHDDILLCDYAGCFRAYHQNCLSPPIKPDVFPEEEEDWFCWQCECLTDCFEMLENEFQGEKFTSWKDVFPVVETGAEGGAAGQQDVLLTDSDDDDDESFKGSSSESEDETAAGKRRRRKASRSDNSGSGSDDDDENSGDSDSDGDGDKNSEADWLSDAESVGSDEVSKLYSEAGDLACSGETDDGDVGSTAAEGGSLGGGRRSRALARRNKRYAALGLGGDHVAQMQLKKRDITAALAGNTMDTANIIESRTRRRKSVDYVKLNQTVFGDESVDGDHVSSDEQDESSEASEGEASDESSGASRRKKKKPKGKSTPSIDPTTGLPRKRGRPRKIEAGTSGAAGTTAGAGLSRLGLIGGTWHSCDGHGLQSEASSAVARASSTRKSHKMPSIDPATGQPRKRGRPRKLVENGASEGGGAGPRKRGRPRKSENGAMKRDLGARSGVEARAPCNPSKTAPSLYSLQKDSKNDAGSAYQTKQGKGRGRPRKDAIAVRKETSANEVGLGLPATTYEDMEDDDTADVAAMAAEVAAKAKRASTETCAASPVQRPGNPS